MILEKYFQTTVTPFIKFNDKSRYRCTRFTRSHDPLPLLLKKAITPRRGHTGPLTLPSNVRFTFLIQFFSSLLSSQYRAQKRMDGEDVFGSKILVRFSEEREDHTNKTQGEYTLIEYFFFSPLSDRTTATALSYPR